MKRKKEEKPEENKHEELEHHLKRALADYANLQRRVEEEKKSLVKFSNAVLIAKLLDVLDGLEAAQKEVNSQGLELVIKKFKDILASENVKEIETEGSFNPEFHEGIGSVPGEVDNQIAEVLQKGYTLDEKILRPARVKITRVEGEKND